MNENMFEEIQGRIANENPFAHAKRMEKAFKMARFLNHHGLTADDSLKATDDEWLVAAGAAKVAWDPRRRHPETIRLVIEHLRALEEIQARIADLRAFEESQAGLPAEEQIYAPFSDE